MQLIFYYAVWEVYDFTLMISKFGKVKIIIHFEFFPPTYMLKSVFQVSSTN